MPDYNQKLRPRGPGKFHLIIDEAMYRTAGDGCDMEAGSVTEIGHWYCFLKDPWMTTPDCEDLELTEDEQDFLAKQKAAILQEDSQGFVQVDYYDCLSIAMQNWEAIEEEVQSWYAESENV